MQQLFRNIRVSYGKFLIPIVPLATAGLSFLYANSDTDSKTTASVSAQLRVSLLPQWPIRRAPLILTPDHLQYGNLQLFLSRIGYCSSENPEGDASANVGDGSKSIATAVAMVLPALVSISVPTRTEKGSGSSRGSGTIIDSNGTILTCAHFVIDSSRTKVTSKGKVDVTLHDGRTFVGTVVDADLHSDVAIVKITSSTPLPSAKLGSSCKLNPGDWVVTMGSPLSLQHSTTAGIVSCVDRKSSELGLGGMFREYIQSDCVPHSGNSGGPLVNLDGEVVGVHIFRVETGLSFAVPIDSISKIMHQFKTKGRFVRPWLGLKMLDLNKTIISQLKDKDPMFPTVDKGVLIVMVTPGSPADLAGLNPGDVVIELRGKPVGSIGQIVELMGGEVGVPLKVVVKRAKDSLVTVTVVPEEANPEL